MSVNEHGELEVETELGPVKFTKPVAYQEIDGKRVEVDVEYSIQKTGIEDQEAECEKQEVVAEGQGGKGEEENSKLTYSFKVASYDKTKDLIIDPLLASTFLGGGSGDCANDITIDKEGNIYVRPCK